MSDELPIDELEISTDEDGERSPERLRVLVVDDHDVVHWGFRLMLTQQPWVERCVSALSGAEALELVVRYRPHVALVDLFIGEESGAEVCERLRAAEPATRVLLFSGAGEISPRAARAAGASGFAYKDWPARRIASAVRMVGLGKTVFERHDRQAALGLSERGARADGVRRHQSRDRRGAASVPAHRQGALECRVPQARGAQPHRGGTARAASGPAALSTVCADG
jgi:DNA-binding NarL/FixJ family response regulator